MARVRLFAATAILLVAADVFAQRIDVVVLRNGDRFTGEVKQLSRGQLTLTTDDAGTIYIEWDKIVAITTAGLYEVGTGAGPHFVGALAPDTNATLRVIATDGALTDLKFADIVSVVRIKAGFFERIDGALDLGGSYTKSSGVGQGSVALEATYRRPGFNVFAETDFNITTQEDEPATSRFAFRTGYTRFRDNLWIVNPFAFIERNPDLGLSIRAAAAIAAGRYVNQSNSNTTLWTAGLALGSEQPIEGESLSNVDALATFATSFYRLDYPKRNYDLTVMLFPSLNRWGRLRANVKARARQELFRDFFATLTVYDTYDNEPPVEDVHVNDFGVTFSLGWTF
jgi:hypothetical protein